MDYSPLEDDGDDFIAAAKTSRNDMIAAIDDTKHAKEIAAAADDEDE